MTNCTQSNENSVPFRSKNEKKLKPNMGGEKKNDDDNPTILVRGVQKHQRNWSTISGGGRMR